MPIIHKDKDGWYIIEGIGNRIYLPESMQNQESIDFLSDYFLVAVVECDNMLVCKRCGLEQVKDSREATRDFVHSDICVGCMKKENE